MNQQEEQGEAGSFFGSESEREEDNADAAQAADSVNYGAQSPVSLRIRARVG